MKHNFITEWFWTHELYSNIYNIDISFIITDALSLHCNLQFV